MAVSMFSPPRVDRSADAWETRSLRSLLTPRSERDRPDLPLLTVARERGVFVRSDEDANHNAIPDDLGNYKVARSGDLVINKMKAWQGSLGLAPVDGIVSPAYFVFEADFEVPRFGEYLLRSKPYVAKFGAASDGVRIGQWDLDISRMRNIEVSLPRADEQAAIAKYLAHANARIEKAISAKRRLLVLLEEQKLAIIREEVDRSGGARLPLKRVMESTTAGVWGLSPEDSKDLPRWCVRVADFDYGLGRVSEWPKTMRSITDKDFRRKKLRPGDLLLEASGGGDKTPVGRVVIFDWQGDAVCSNFLQRLRPVTGVISEYLALILRDMHATGAVRLHIKQTTGIQNLDLDSYFTTPVPIPEMRIQREVLGRVQARSSESDRASAQAFREIALLEEFRTRLVADVVTGQVDVRAIAASLPETPELDTDLDSLLDDDLVDVLGEGEE